MSAQHSQERHLHTEQDSFKFVVLGAASSSASAEIHLSSQNWAFTAQHLCHCGLPWGFGYVLSGFGSLTSFQPPLARGVSLVPNSSALLWNGCALPNLPSIDGMGEGPLMPPVHGGEDSPFELELLNWGLDDPKLLGLYFALLGLRYGNMANISTKMESNFNFKIHFLSKLLTHNLEISNKNSDLLTNSSSYLLEHLCHVLALI